MQQNQIPFDYLKKVVLVGDSYVGKSSLLLRFVDDSFGQERYQTIGVDFRYKLVKVQDIICKLQIWDTAGAERFRSITTGYYRGASGIILVYDVSNRESFKSISYHLQSIQETIDKISPQHQIQNIQYILIGSKIDLTSRQVSTDEGQQLANDKKMMFIEVSSLSSHNVTLAFETLADAMVSNQGPPQQKEFSKRTSQANQLPQQQGPHRNLMNPAPAKRYNCI